MTDRHRSAITGEFVTAEHAATNPDTTVSEARDHQPEPIVRTVGDLTARHVGKRVRGRTWEGELLLLQASAACVDIVLEGKPYPHQLCLTLDTPCEVLP